MALKWLKSYLSDIFLVVHVNNCSSCTNVSCGVPQSSVLGPIVLSFYICCLQEHNVSFHCYADDTQLYLYLRRHKANQIALLDACINDVKTWINFLLLNLDKTEVIVIGPKHLREATPELYS